MNRGELIQQERREAEQRANDIWDVYDNDEKRHVKLNRKNVITAEALILNDSAYSKSFDPTVEGTSAYYMTQLKEIIEKETYSPDDYKHIISEAVDAVDRENSTHLNADGGKQIIKDRISSYEPEKLKLCLQDPNGHEELVRDIAERTFPRKGARKNISFASKFCHYACFYIYKGEESQDNYPIFDTVLQTALPWYLDYYKVNIPKLDFNQDDKAKLYREYRMAIDRLLAAVEKEDSEKISRNGLDQLLWYYYKNQ